MVTIELATNLIKEQFPEYARLAISDIEVQGHDNRTYRLGSDMLIRIPTAESYALKIPLEYEILPKLATNISIPIPEPIKLGQASELYPYPFAIYKWLEGTSANQIHLDKNALENLAQQLAEFLRELQNIKIKGPTPGQHNWWRGDKVSVYDANARTQIANLKDIIDSNAAIKLWDKACATNWHLQPVWLHGDFAAGNILVHNNKLSGVIDFGCTAVGDPACDLVIAWTYLTGNARDIFMQEMQLDSDTWLRARAWALWKATFELCKIIDKSSAAALAQERIINDLLVQK